MSEATTKSGQQCWWKGKKRRHRDRRTSPVKKEKRRGGCQPAGKAAAGVCLFPSLSTHPIALLLVRICLGAQLLDAQEEADSIADFVNSHLLQHFLVHFQKILSIDVILAENLLVVPALDASEIFAHVVLVPVLHGISTVGLGELRLGWAGVVLGATRHGGQSSRGGQGRLQVGAGSKIRGAEGGRERRF